MTVAKCILIVDDEPEIREVLRTYLVTKENYSVEEAGDIREATDVIRKTRVDIVFLDIQLPGVDGIEILKVLKKNDKSIKVVMMSGYATEEIAKKSLEEGAFDYLRKPFELLQIDRILASIEISDMEVL